MGVNHAHAHEDEELDPEQAARERAARFARALEAVLRDHARALALAGGGGAPLDRAGGGGAPLDRATVEA